MLTTISADLNLHKEILYNTADYCNLPYFTGTVQHRSNHFRPDTWKNVKLSLLSANNEE